MLSMFELTTGDNWPDTMHQAMDATAVDSQPVLNHSSQNALYFVAFICVGFFLMVKVFVGVFMKEARRAFVPFCLCYCPGDRLKTTRSGDLL